MSLNPTNARTFAVTSLYVATCITTQTGSDHWAIVFADGTGRAFMIDWDAHYRKWAVKEIANNITVGALSLGGEPHLFFSIPLNIPNPFNWVGITYLASVRLHEAMADIVTSDKDSLRGWRSKDFVYFFLEELEIRGHLKSKRGAITFWKTIKDHTAANKDRLGGRGEGSASFDTMICL